MPDKSVYMAAAKKLPKNRDSREQALVDEAHRTGMQDVKNEDFDSKRQQSAGL